MSAHFIFRELQGKISTFYFQTVSVNIYKLKKPTSKKTKFRALRLHNLKIRAAMNAKISVFVVCVEAIIYFFVYDLHNCFFNLITSSVQKMVTNTSKILQQMPQDIQKSV